MDSELNQCVGSSMSHICQEIDINYRGLRITVFKNGDEYDRGTIVVISRRRFKHWLTFLDFLTLKLRLMAPVHELYSVDGHHIQRFEEIENGGNYVAVSQGPFLYKKYGVSDEDREILRWNSNTKVVPDEGSTLNSGESVDIYLKKRGFASRTGLPFPFDGGIRIGHSLMDPRNSPFMLSPGIQSRQDDPVTNGERISFGSDLDDGQETTENASALNEGSAMEKPIASASEVQSQPEIITAQIDSENVSEAVQSAHETNDPPVAEPVKENAGLQQLSRLNEPTVSSACTEEETGKGNSNLATAAGISTNQSAPQNSTENSSNCEKTAMAVIDQRTSSKIADSGRESVKACRLPDEDDSTKSRDRQNDQNISLHSKHRSDDCTNENTTVSQPTATHINAVKEPSKIGSKEDKGVKENIMGGGRGESKLRRPKAFEFNAGRKKWEKKRQKNDPRRYPTGTDGYSTRAESIPDAPVRLNVPNVDAGFGTEERSSNLPCATGNPDWDAITSQDQFCMSKSRSCGDIYFEPDFTPRNTKLKNRKSKSVKLLIPTSHSNHEAWSGGFDPDFSEFDFIYSECYFPW